MVKKHVFERLFNEFLTFYRIYIVQFAIGVSYGLRGIKEHKTLNLRDITFGFFPLTAGGGLAGKEYVQLGGTILSKANQLTLGKSVLIARPRSGRAHASGASA